MDCRTLFTTYLITGPLCFDSFILTYSLRPHIPVSQPALHTHLAVLDTVRYAN